MTNRTARYRRLHAPVCKDMARGSLDEHDKLESAILLDFFLAFRVPPCWIEMSVWQILEARCISLPVKHSAEGQRLTRMQQSSPILHPPLARPTRHPPA